ncbi:MAG: hypothetical protein L6R45_18920 [Anaerolineae bacterium]|nr:hypothetical protein [Anaerolineae bacterium]
MARKRVSLKDKGPETLGLTEKKGQGIDVLFGGSAVAKTRAASTPESKSNQPEGKEKTMAAENNEPLTNAVVNTPSAPESLPVNEADNDFSPVSSAAVDELGLPVAMEAPPTRLMATRSVIGEVDELGLPVAMEAPPTDLTVPVPPSPPPLPVVDSATTDVPPPTDDNDLSGLAGEEEEVSNLPPAVEAPATPTPVTDFSPTPVPIEPAPIPPVSTPEPAPTTPVEPTPAVPPIESVPLPPPIPSPVAETPVEKPLPEPPPVTYTPPPVYVPPTPAVTAPMTVSVASPPPPPQIESITGFIAGPMAVRPENLLPQDYEYGSGGLQLADRARVERDDAITERVERYLGKERREALDKEIERLYEVVANELSDNNEDVSFALKALSEAQDIVLEDIRQYDEALYRVALVKTMLVRRRNLKRWSYTWGSFVFFYAIAWLALFVTAIVFTGNINTTVGSLAGQSGGLEAGRSAWYSALAGGIGGVIGILYSLYWRVAVKQNFDRQYLMYYLVQPIMGFFLGAVTHLIITAGFLTFNASGADSTITVILQMVIGFVAGFRQRVVYELIDRIVQKIAPEESDKSPTSVVPEQ